MGNYDLQKQLHDGRTGLRRIELVRFQSKKFHQSPIRDVHDQLTEADEAVENVQLFRTLRHLQKHSPD